MQTNLQNEGKILDWDCMEVDISRQGPIKDQMKVRIPRLSGQGIQLISLQLQMHCMEKAQMHNRSDVAADPQIVWAGYCNSLDIAILCYTFSLQKGANAKMQSSLQVLNLFGLGRKLHFFVTHYLLQKCANAKPYNRYQSNLQVMISWDGLGRILQLSLEHIWLALCTMLVVYHGTISTKGI